MKLNISSKNFKYYEKETEIIKQGEPKNCANLLAWRSSELGIYAMFENPYHKACEDEPQTCK